MPKVLLQVHMNVLTGGGGPAVGTPPTLRHIAQWAQLAVSLVTRGHSLRAALCIGFRVAYAHCGTPLAGPEALITAAVAECDLALFEHWVAPRGWPVAVDLADALAHASVHRAAAECGIVLYSAFAGDARLLRVAARVYLEATLRADANVRAAYLRDLLAAWSAPGGVACMSHPAQAAADAVWRHVSARFREPFSSVIDLLFGAVASVMAEVGVPHSGFDSSHATFDVRDALHVHDMLSRAHAEHEGVADILAGFASLSRVLEIVDARLECTWGFDHVTLPRALHVVKEHFAALGTAADEWIDVR